MEIGLDWFMYLHSEEGGQNLRERNHSKLLKNVTKVLRGVDKSLDNNPHNTIDRGDRELPHEQAQH